MNLDVVDQPIGGRIVGGSFVRVGQIALDGLGQRLAQLNAPLVERVDVPDDTLGEDLVLVHGDQRTQRERGHLLDEDRVGRAVSGEDLVRQELLQLVTGHTGLFQLGTGLRLGLAHHQRLRLGQEVGQQDLVHGTVLDRVVGDDRGNKVTRDQTGALEMEN